MVAIVFGPLLVGLMILPVLLIVFALLGFPS